MEFVVVMLEAIDECDVGDSVPILTLRRRLSLILNDVQLDQIQKKRKCMKQPCIFHRQLREGVWTFYTRIQAQIHNCANILIYYLLIFIGHNF